VQRAVFLRRKELLLMFLQAGSAGRPWPFPDANQYPRHPARRAFPAQYLVCRRVSPSRHPTSARQTFHLLYYIRGSNPWWNALPAPQFAALFWYRPDAAPAPDSLLYNRRKGLFCRGNPYQHRKEFLKASFCRSRLDR